MSFSHPPSPLAAALMALLLCAPALAETGGAPRAPGALTARSPFELEVQSSLPGLDAKAIESAVRAELAESFEAATPGTQLLIFVNEQRLARLEVRAATGEVRTRELALPAESKSALEILGLVSASLVRSDADALAAALRAAKTQAPAATGAATTEPAETSPAASDESAAATPEGSARGSSDANAPEQPAAIAEPPAPLTKAPAAAPPEKATAEPAAPEATPLESAPANLSFVHPIAILPDSDQKELGFELGLFYGHVGALGGFGANGLALLANRHAHGVLVAGLWSDVGGAGSGANFAGVVSRGGGAFEGVTSSGVLDFREGKVTGLQAAGVWGKSEGLLGVQVGGVAAMSQEVTGLQTSGVLVMSHAMSGVQAGGVIARAHVVDGLQAAGVYADAHGTSGLQVAGVFASADDVLGFQTAGLVTWAEDTQGLGLAGLVGVGRDVEGARIAPINLGRDTIGAQIGVVNVGRTVRGTQIGVVNVADRVDGFPIGVVNAVGNGQNQALAWTGGQRMPLNAGFRYLHAPESAPSVYTLLFMGMDPESDADDRYAPGLAVGLRSRGFGPGSRIFLEGDLMWRTETTFQKDAKTAQAMGPRLAIGLRLAPWLALFTGVAPLVYVDDDGVSGPEPLDLPQAGVQVL